MKKVGIITIHSSYNYGASLQAYALWKYILDNGYESEIIDLSRPQLSDYVPSERFQPYKKNKVSRWQEIKRILRQRLLFVNLQTKEIESEFELKFQSFHSKISLSKHYSSIDDLYNDPPIYDTYVSGSDQIWNPTRLLCVEPYFLTFVNNGASKISYASSIGVSVLDDEVKADYKQWLSQYRHISVREKTAQTLLSDLTDKPIEWVLDPTFLLTREQWLSLSQKPKVNSQYILLFTLSYSEKLRDYALRIKKESGLELVYLSMKQPDTENYIVEKNAGVEDFIGYINNAELMITDSFHGTVMALQTNCKNIFTYIKNGNPRASRITDIYDLLGVENHILRDSLDLSFHQMQNMSLNREKLDSTIEVEAKRSRNYLLSIL